MLLFLAWWSSFKFYWATQSYSSHLFLYALVDTMHGLINHTRTVGLPNTVANICLSAWTEGKVPNERCLYARFNQSLAKWFRWFALSYDNCLFPNNIVCVFVCFSARGRSLASVLPDHGQPVDGRCSQGSHPLPVSLIVQWGWKSLWLLLPWPALSCYWEHKWTGS